MLCTVTNCGTEVVHHPIVTLYDKNSHTALQSQIIPVSVNPGATVQQEVYFRMPSDFDHSVYEIGIEEEGKPASGVGDHFVLVDLSKTELSVSTEYRVVKEGKYIVVNVENCSNVSAIADVTVTKPNGDILLSKDGQTIPANEIVEFMTAVDNIIPEGASDIILTASAKTMTEEYYQSNNVCEQRIWNIDWSEPVILKNEKKIQSIVLSMTDASLTANNTLQLKAEIIPKNATKKELKWSSDNEQVAIVDQNGLVTAIGAGKATIAAESQDGSGISASCVITVTKTSDDHPDQNDPSDNNGSGGSSGGYPGGAMPGGNTGSHVPGSAPGNNTPIGKPDSDSNHLQVNLLYYITNFDANGGTGLSRKTMTLLMDDTLGILPKVKRKNYILKGWYTQKTGGKKVDESTVLNASSTLYAQWSRIKKPAKVKNLTLICTKSGQMKVKFQKVSGVAGYQITYSVDKEFASAAVKKADAVSGSMTLKKLKKGKKYYVKVRAYNEGSMGEKIYGSYCKAKSIQIKK